TRLLEALSERHKIVALELPGFGESQGEELLEDMLDFALHGWDVLAALGLVESKPVLVGHSLGGMIAAEMACLAPQSVAKLVLVDAFGLWLDAEPVPDVFAMTPHELLPLLFSDGRHGADLDTTDPAAFGEFLVATARRMG